MSKYLEVHEVDAVDWDELVDKCPLSTVYHRIGWLGVIEECEQIDIKLLACYREDQLLALWPVGMIRKGPFRIAGSPLPGWNTAYLGPIFSKACGDGNREKIDVLNAILESRVLSKPSFIATRCMDVGLDLTSLGFSKNEDFETCEIDLTRDEDELFASLKGTCRNRIRKGIKNGLEVRVEKNAGYIDDFWLMAIQVFAKTNKQPPFSKKFLEIVHDRLYCRGELLVTSVFSQEKRIAILIIPHDGKTGMYFAGGAYNDMLSLAPNNLLHWNTILECKYLGMLRYDFISNRGAPGKFKKTFSPDERVSCVHWERSKNRFIKWARDRYEVWARKKRRVN